MRLRNWPQNTQLNSRHCSPRPMFCRRCFMIRVRPFNWGCIYFAFKCCVSQLSVDQVQQKFATLLTWPMVISPPIFLPNLSTDGQENATFAAKKCKPTLKSRTLLILNFLPFMYFGGGTHLKVKWTHWIKILTSEFRVRPFRRRGTTSDPSNSLRQLHPPMAPGPAFKCQARTCILHRGRAAGRKG